MESKLELKTVSVQDINAYVTAKVEINVIDLLPPDHFSGRHIPGAKNACVFHVSFLDDLAAVVPDKKSLVVVYGASSKSQDALVALDKLERAGYTDISYVEGGLEAWHAAGYDLEGDEMQPVLEAHLQSDDFFFTKMFPKAIFTVKSTERIDPGWLTTPNYHVAGELNLRGVSANLEFDATVAHAENDALIMEAHFDIDRTRWNVIYGSTRFFEYLGMHKVFDLISLQLRVIAVPG